MRTNDQLRQAARRHAADDEMQRQQKEALARVTKAIQAGTKAIAAALLGVKPNDPQLSKAIGVLRGVSHLLEVKVEKDLLRMMEDIEID